MPREVPDDPGDAVHLPVMHGRVLLGHAAKGAQPLGARETELVDERVRPGRGHNGILVPRLRSKTRRGIIVPLARRSDSDEPRIKDRSEKLRKERQRMPVHGAGLKDPDIQRVLLSGRRKRVTGRPRNT